MQTPILQESNYKEEMQTIVEPVSYTHLGTG